MYLQYRLSALLQLHLHSRLNAWLQMVEIGQRQPSEETRNIYILGFGAVYIRGLTVVEERQHRISSAPLNPAICHYLSLVENDPSSYDTCSYTWQWMLHAIYLIKYARHYVVLHFNVVISLVPMVSGCIYLLVFSKLALQTFGIIAWSSQYEKSNLKDTDKNENYRNTQNITMGKKCA